MGFLYIASLQKESLLGSNGCFSPSLTNVKAVAPHRKLVSNFRSEKEKKPFKKDLNKSVAVLKHWAREKGWIPLLSG